MANGAIGGNYDKDAMARAGYTQVSQGNFWDGPSMFMPTASSDPSNDALNALTAAAQEFMREWQAEKGIAKGYYDDAFESVGNVEGMADKYAAELEAFRGKFGGLKDNLLNMSQEDMDRRSEMAGDFMTYAKPDYETAGNNAMNDIASQAEIGRQAANRALQGMGINPASGNYQNQARQSRVNEAASKVLAANQARQEETRRAADMAGLGVQIFDPNIGLDGALNIQDAEGNLLTGQSNALQVGSQLRNQLVDSYGKNIVLPAGEAAGSTYGAVAGWNLSQQNQNSSGGGGGGGGTSGEVLSGFTTNGSAIPQGPITPSPTYGMQTDSSGSTYWGMD